MGAHMLLFLILRKKGMAAPKSEDAGRMWRALQQPQNK